MTIINNSGWDHTNPVNLHTKDNLVQGLIVDEVIGKRERQLRAMRRGLQHLGVLDLLLKHPKQTEELFIYKAGAGHVCFTTIRSCLTTKQTTSSCEQQAMEWLLEYLEARDMSGTIILIPKDITIIPYFTCRWFHRAGHPSAVSEVCYWAGAVPTGKKT